MTTASTRQPITLSTHTKDYQGNPLHYSVTFTIPIIPEYFGRWADQCIALTRQKITCMSPVYKERSLVGLCSRHHAQNVESGGSNNAHFPPAPEAVLPELTPTSMELFVELCEDAENWGGQPLVNGNISVNSQRAGNLTDLNIKGIIVLDIDTKDRDALGNNLVWVNFTDLGRALAEAHGIEITG